MGPFLLRRLSLVIPVLLMVSFLTFSMQFVEHSDFGRSRPRPDSLGVGSYLEWLGKMARGDMGRSWLRHGIPVGEAISGRLPVTLELALLSLTVSLALAIPGGILAATRRNSSTDNVTSFLAITANSTPEFLLGILLILFLAVFLRWLPPSGFVPFAKDPLDNLRHMLMPAATLGAGMAALTLRMTRASLLEAISQDYVRTARSKGLTEGAVILRHAFRNAFLPVLTIMGLQVGLFLEGALIVEIIFALPGLGQLAVQSLFLRDFPMVQAIILLMSTTLVLVNLLVDILYFCLDPRMRIK